jgi:hypothetical protein
MGQVRCFSEALEPSEMLTGSRAGACALKVHLGVQIGLGRWFQGWQTEGKKEWKLAGRHIGRQAG